MVMSVEGSGSAVSLSAVCAAAAGAAVAPADGGCLSWRIVCSQSRPASIAVPSGSVMEGGGGPCAAVGRSRMK